jgi:DNA-binding response OmpR family regulator
VTAPARGCYIPLGIRKIFDPQRTPAPRGMRLLVVDDDPVLVDLVREALDGEGYSLDVARNCAEARLLAAVHPYDGVVLDVMLPDGTGTALLAEMREEGNAVPVLMLTSRSEERDVIRGLDAGADDYLAKPFSVGELRARMRALLRRARPAPAARERVVFGDLVLDRLSHVISKDGKRLRLTPKEHSLLEYFLLNPARVLSRAELLDKVWDIRFDPGSNLVDTHVARLRAKLERHGVRAEIATVRGAGFVLGGDEPSRSLQA